MGGADFPSLDSIGDLGFFAVITPRYGSLRFADGSGNVGMRVLDSDVTSTMVRACPTSASSPCTGMAAWPGSAPTAMYFALRYRSGRTAQEELDGPCAG